MAEDFDLADNETLRQVRRLLAECATARLSRPEAACALIVAGFGILADDLGSEAAAALVTDTVDHVAAEVRAFAARTNH